MNYWKKVYAGDYKKYSAELYELFVNNYNEHFYYVNDFWNPVKAKTTWTISKIIPDFEEVIEIFGPIKEMALLVLNSDSATLHVDHTIGLNGNVYARLNIPVLNCTGSTTAFFDLDKDTYAKHTTSPGGTKGWPSELRNSLQPVTQVELVEPTVLRTSVPHTVFCHSCNFPRISLTISFRKDLVSLLD